MRYGLRFCTKCGVGLKWIEEESQEAPPEPGYQQSSTASNISSTQKAAAPDWKFSLIIGVCLAVVALGGFFAYGLLSPLPVISGVGANVVSGSIAVITWQTDIPSTGQVEYGTTAQYGTVSFVDSSSQTNHSIALEGLSPKTTYHCRAKSKASNWNPAVSSDLTFTTP